jgi:hypothetical protein
MMMTMIRDEPKTPLGDGALEIIRIQADNLHYLMVQSYKINNRVRYLHKKLLTVCAECGKNYPCNTIEALDGKSNE